MKHAPFMGILLAAGKGVRYDPSGHLNKLLQPLPDGTPIVVAAARCLQKADLDVIAVVRSRRDVVAHRLRAEGCRIVECLNADEGMGASLVCGVQAAPDHSRGYLIALADMPYVDVSTIKAVVETVDQGADIAAPMCDGRRGNPVAFSAKHRVDLLRLGGEAGGRGLLKQFPVQEVQVEDNGIFQDIDRPEDLSAAR